MYISYRIHSVYDTPTAAQLSYWIEHRIYTEFITTIQCRSRYAPPTLPWATSTRRQLVLIHRLEGALSLLRAVLWVSQEVGAWPSTTSRAATRPAGLVASAHRARVANTHRRRGSALETVPCATAAAPRPLHLHRTLRRARKRLLARPRAAARARALPTGPHPASAAFLKGASRAAAVWRVPRSYTRLGVSYLHQA